MHPARRPDRGARRRAAQARLRRHPPRHRRPRLLLRQRSQAQDHTADPRSPSPPSRSGCRARRRGRRPAVPHPPGRRLSHDALERRIAKHASTASRACPSLQHKKITPHVLRHTAAVRLLQAPVDTTTIALWLGHASDQTTQVYLHADLTLKQRAIDRTTPPGTKPGRYRPPDPLLAFLEAL